MFGRVCCFNVLNNKRLVEYMRSIGLWAKSFPDVLATDNEPSIISYQFLIADWSQVCNQVEKYKYSVIAIGEDSAEAAVNAFQQGCFDYVRATSFIELGARLKRLAERCQFWSAPVYRWHVGQIIIDDITATVSKNNCIVHVTKTEYALLTLLRNNALSSKKMLAHQLGIQETTVPHMVWRINSKLGKIIGSTNRNYKFTQQVSVLSKQHTDKAWRQ